MSRISGYTSVNCFQTPNRIPVIGCAIAMWWHRPPNLVSTNASLIATQIEVVRFGYFTRLFRFGVHYLICRESLYNCFSGDSLE